MKRPEVVANIIVGIIAVVILAIALSFAGCASRRAYPLAPLAPTISQTLPPAPASLPGFLSGIANVFSTPEGRADRQAVRLIRAAVPRSVGKGAVYAVNSRVISGGNKPSAPVTQADSGATVSNAAANAQQQTVRGNANKLAARQANPTQAALGPLAVLAQNLTGWIPWAILAALVLAVVLRKRLPFIGPFFS